MYRQRHHNSAPIKIIYSNFTKQNSLIASFPYNIQFVCLSSLLFLFNSANQCNKSSTEFALYLWLLNLIYLNSILSINQLIYFTLLYVTWLALVLVSFLSVNLFEIGWFVSEFPSINFFCWFILWLLQNNKDT